MFQRPLIPILFSFFGGIFICHNLLSSYHGFILPVFLCVAVFLFTALFMSSRLRIYFLLLTFFFTGIFLTLQKHGLSQIEPLASQRDKVTIEGTILEPVKRTKKTARIRVRAHRVFVRDEMIWVNEDILVSVYYNFPRLEPGEKIRFPARLRHFKNFNNPGRYDYESAMKMKGFVCAASVSDGRRIVLMGQGNLPFSRRFVEKIQRPTREFFQKRLDNQDCALFRALILGERQDISPSLREHFNQTGLGHVLAVSGLHIGLVAGVVFFLFRGVFLLSYRLVLKTDISKLAAFLTCLPVIGYTCLAGFQVSSQRAMIMVLAFLWSVILGREKEVWSTLALAALLILAVDPQAMFSISFQLSFIAVIGILWLTPAILKRIPMPSETPQRKKTVFDFLFIYFIGLMVVSFSAMVFLLPVTTFYFHRISLVTILANVTVVPVLGLWVIPFGLLSAVALPIFPQAAGAFLELGSWGLHAIMAMIRFWSDLPWSSFWVITPNLFEMFMFYALITFIVFYKRWKGAKIGILILAIIISADIAYWTHSVRFNRDLRVTFLDVGQANAALIAFPGGKKMLIDGGGFSGDTFNVGKMVVAPCLWHSKIARIDYLVLSHPQSDHMNGLRFIARAFHPKEFWYNGDRVETASFKELISIIESKKIKKLLPADLSCGREINGVRVEVLHPMPVERSIRPFKNARGLNNNSLVLKISFAGKSFLFPGDIEREGEKILISNAGHGVKSDIILSPHHGSRSSSTKEFLNMVRPGICVISSGEGNFFGFPHEQTLRRLRDIGCRVIRIDRTGAVKISVGPDRFDVRTFFREKEM